MAGRDGQKGASVIVESGQIVVACGFNYLIKIPGNAPCAVMKPPRRADAQAGPMARHRGQLTGIGGLV